MEAGIDKDEWWPVYVPSFIDDNGQYYISSYTVFHEFTDEEVCVIKNAFMLFDSAQAILKDKYNKVT